MVRVWLVALPNLLRLELEPRPGVYCVLHTTPLSLSHQQAAMERQYQPDDQVHTHVRKLGARETNGSHQGQSKSVDQLEHISGDMTRAHCSLGSADSLNEHPRKNLLRKWHRDTVTHGSDITNKEVYFALNTANTHTVKSDETF